ncbi:hypothetical protein MTO96_046563 [Rhipicephalus appendiculatus]
MDAGDVTDVPVKLQSFASVDDDRPVPAAYRSSIAQLSLFRGDNKPVTWRLKLFPRGSDEGYEQFCPSFSSPATPGASPLRRGSRSSTPMEKRAVRKRTETLIFLSKGDGWGFGKLIARRALKQNSSNLLPNDTLTLKCEVVALGKYHHECARNEQRDGVPSSTGMPALRRLGMAPGKRQQRRRYVDGGKRDVPGSQEHSGFPVTDVSGDVRAHDDGGCQGGHRGRGARRVRPMSCGSSTRGAYRNPSKSRTVFSGPLTNIKWTD